MCGVCAVCMLSYKLINFEVVQELWSNVCCVCFLINFEVVQELWSNVCCVCFLINFEVV